MLKNKINYDIYEKLLFDLAELYFKKEKENLLSIVLYGSVARGSARPESDLDILIVLDNAPASYYERIEPYLEIRDRLEKGKNWQLLLKKGLQPYMSILILSKSEADQNRRLFLDMMEEAKIIFDKGNYFNGRMEEVSRRTAVLGSRKIILGDGTWYWEIKPDLKLGEVFTL